MILPQRKLLRPSRRAFLRGAIAALFVIPSAGRAWFKKGTSGGGGYEAKAVHFPSGTVIKNSNAVAVADSPFFLASIWTKMTLNTVGVFPYLFYFTNNNNAAAIAQLEIGLSNLADIGATISNTNVGPTASWIADAGTFQAVQWNNIIISADASGGLGANVLQMAYNGAVLTTTINPMVTEPFTILWSALQDMYLGDDFDSPPDGIDMCDPWIGCGQFLDLTVTSNIEKFRNAAGKPVFLGANGELPTGTSPTIFCSGPASTFATNLGTVGPTAVEGPPITNASSSPSD